MILLGRLCRCHYASNPAVSAAVRVACLSAFQASPGPRRPSLGPRLLGPPFWSPELQDSASLLLPLAFVPQLSFCCPPLSATQTVLNTNAHCGVAHLSDANTQRATLLSCYLFAFFYSLHHFFSFAPGLSLTYMLCFRSPPLWKLCLCSQGAFAVSEVTGEVVTLSPFSSMFICRAAPSPCLRGSCYQCQGMSLCLMTEPLSGWRRLSG